VTAWPPSPWAESASRNAPERGQTKAYLEWDAKAERFTNNEAANRLLNYEYRKPYKLPS
jgi:hypothetical protein